ncbi:MAG TPA: hypothetical protein VFI08_02920, partial [Spirochaetia bacterium]|nr:hypothetical protein [Spirochaetia bacterium]
MRKLTRYLAFAGIAIILGSCSFATGALNHKKARVVASALWRGKTTAAARAVRTAGAANSLTPFVGRHHALPPRPARAATAKVRASNAVKPKDLSASTDIDYITYSIVNLDPGSGESEIDDFLDPYYP